MRTTVVLLNSSRLSLKKVTNAVLHLCLGKRSSNSKTSFTPLMHPQSIFVYQFFPGPNFDLLKVASNSTPYWTMTAIFLHLQVLQMPKHLILPTPEH
jgi:hypothetical protein